MSESAPHSHRVFCLVSAFYPPHVGGVERYTASLARALVAAGHTVIVVTSGDRSEVDVDTEDGIEVIRLPSYRLLGGRFPVLHHNAAVDRAWQTLRERSIDAVVVQTRLYPLSLVGMKFAHAKGLRPIVIEHGSAPIGFGNPGLDWFVHRYEALLCAWSRRYAPRYFGVSTKSAQWLERFSLQAEGVLTNAIDPRTVDGFAPAPAALRALALDDGAFIVTFVGRLVKAKGFVKLCEAVQWLNVEEAADIHLCIAGDGPDQGLLKPFLDDHIHYLGSLNPTEVAGLLAHSSVFCFPSDYPEGFPTVLLEAASYHLPLISSNTGGTDELIPDGRYGIVLPDTGMPTIAAAIEYVHDHQSDAAQWGAAVASRVFERFTWEQTASRLIELAATEDPKKENSHDDGHNHLGKQVGEGGSRNAE